MTTLNPSHNIFRSPEGRHAQAVHEPEKSADPEKEDFSDDGAEESGVRRAKREARRRVRRAAPPMPDLRFEQSYLLSIRPFLTPSATPFKIAENGTATDRKAQETKSLVLSAEDDAVFKWGRDVQVNWRMVVYVTLRDQVLSPLIQGAFWGFGTLFLAGTAATLRSALYPASHVPRGRVTGGAGGKVSEAGGGSAVGETGWWRRFVRSWTGAVETATV